MPINRQPKGSILKLKAGILRGSKWIGIFRGVGRNKGKVIARSETTKQSSNHLALSFPPLRDKLQRQSIIATFLDSATKPALSLVEWVRNDRRMYEIATA
jgi:hypothetical protein